MKKRYYPISTRTARELIWAQRTHGQGGIFGVAFRRRTDSADGKCKAGDLQVLYGRFGVKRHLKGGYARHADTGAVVWMGQGGAAYDRCAHNLFCFYVMARPDGRERGYRCIPFDQLQWLKLNGVVYRVGRGPVPQR